MGRYYNGDIEGKFWFGVQSSDDATFFGGREIEPSEVEYQFEDEDLSLVKDGIKKCKEKLGKNEELITKFFQKKDGWNKEMFEDEYGWDGKTTRENLEWYARLELGEKIYKCLKEKGHCNFVAEL
jgi:hypothetical protein